MRALVLAPHADDETLGCGGLLARLAHDAAVAVVCEPDQVRAHQLEQAVKRLGVTELWWGGQVDGRVADDPVDLQVEVDTLVQRWRPEQLYVPSPQAHQDHQAVYAAGLRTLRHSRKLLHRPAEVLAYDVPSYPAVTVGAPVWQLLDPADLLAKADALDWYDGQAIPPRDATLAAARAAGARVGARYAELYQLVHQVRR